MANSENNGDEDSIETKDLYEAGYNETDVKKN